jgi:hypothetical protein
MLDPQRLNLYAYGRNNPLRFADPTGMELQVGNCGPNQTVTSCVAMLKAGLRKEDRTAVSVISGTGNNGCTKGAYCVAVDQNHSSTSNNFSALQFVANKKDVAILEGRGPSDRISSFSFRVIPIAAQYGYEPTMNKGTGAMGATLDPIRRPPTTAAEQEQLYSLDNNTHVVFATAMSFEDIVTTMYHEIWHVFLGDFGRLSRGDHPQANPQIKAAEDEAEQNLKEK